MQVTIIGSGSAYGVPAIGDDWGDCDPTEPKNKRTGPSILIENDTTKILIDMSADFREQSNAFKIRKLDGILFTHEHADHMIGNWTIPRLMKYQDANLPLYALPRTQCEIISRFDYQYDDKALTKFHSNGRPVWRDIVPYKEFVIGDINVKPLEQMHGRITSLGFRIRDFAYSTDFNDFPQATFEGLAGLDTWVVECNSLTKKDNSPEIKHQFLSNTLEFIDRVKPRRAILTHMDESIDYDTVSRIIPSHVELAYDGMKLQI